VVSPWHQILVFAVALGLTAALTPLAIHVGRRHGLVAEPGGRRRHVGRVVRIGGFALFPAFAVAALLPVWLGLDRQDPLELTRLTAVLVGLGIVWIGGLWDDAKDLPAWAQALILVVGALVAIVGKVFIEIFNSPLGDQQVHLAWYLMLPVTLVWIAGMSSTVNVLDGLDGLAAGVTAIASAVLYLHMMRLGQETVALLPLALVGVCLGFLPFNLLGTRIFLGGGAYVLGYALATLSIVSGAKVASALLVLWVPVLDVLWQVYWRWRCGQPLGRGDRGHLHYRLYDLGWTARQVVCLYWATTAVLGVAALAISSRLLKLGILALVALLALVAMAALSRSIHPPEGR